MDSPVLAPPAVDPTGALAPVEFDPQRQSGQRLRSWLTTLRWPLSVYLASRVLYLVIALVDSLTRHWPLLNAGVGRLSEVTNWDGMWYVRLATQGYPHGYIADHLHHWQTTLGFFPLFSMVIWVVWHALFITPDDAGLIVSMVGGFVGIVLVGELARSWWDEA